MKKSTTDIRSRFTKAMIVPMVFAIGIVPVTQVFADSYDDQIKKIQSDVVAYQNQAGQLHAQADTLQNAVNELNAQKAAIQSQIDLSQAKLEKVKADIQVNENKLDRQKKTINKTVAQIYANGSTTPIEMVASSKNIGDYVSSQAVRGSVQTQLKNAMDAVKKIKAQLAAQQVDVEHLIADQQSQRDALAAKESEQAQLLASTQGQEAAYQGLIGQKNNQINSLKAQQAAAYASYTGSHGGSMYGAAGNGGYPDRWANAPQDSMGDDWGLYNRECVSYVAWKVSSVGRYMPFVGDKDANAWNWPNLFPNKVTGRPSVGTPTGVAVVWGRGGAMGPLGHIAYVETVNGDGSIEVSQYNVVHGKFNRMHVSSSEASYLTYLQF